MGHTLYKLWFHLVWSTKDWEPQLTKEIRPHLFLHIKHKARAEGWVVDTINGMPDHIHCLISIPPKYSISDVVNRLKGESSHWINYEKLTPLHFAWQTGFGVFSVSESQVQRVRRYIVHQEEHHRTKTFAEEIEELARLSHADSYRSG